MGSIENKVIDFVARRAAVKAQRLVPHTTLFGDLGLDGADGWELVEEFGREFKVDLSDFHAARHFGPEGVSVFAPIVWLFWVIAESFRGKRTPEERAGMVPIRISDLVRSVQEGKWVVYSDSQK